MNRDEIERAEHWDPKAGDTITGEVVRLPEPSVYRGRNLVLRTTEGVVLVAASPSEGGTVIANALSRLDPVIGDVMAITFDGWRAATTSGRRYRMFEVEVR